MMKTRITFTDGHLTFPGSPEDWFRFLMTDDPGPYNIDAVREGEWVIVQNPRGADAYFRAADVIRLEEHRTPSYLADLLGEGWK